MDNSLRYAVTLTAEGTKQLVEVRNELLALQQLLKEGGEFKIKVSDDVLADLKKDLRAKLQELANMKIGGKTSTYKNFQDMATGTAEAGGMTEKTGQEILKVLRALAPGGAPSAEESRRVPASDRAGRSEVKIQEALQGLRTALTGAQAAERRNPHTEINTLKKFVEEAVKASADKTTASTVRDMLKQLMQREGSTLGATQIENESSKRRYEQRFQAFGDQIENMVKHLLDANTRLRHNTSGFSGVPLGTSPSTKGTDKEAWAEMGRTIARAVLEGLRAAPPAGGGRNVTPDIDANDFRGEPLSDAGAARAAAVARAISPAHAARAEARMANRSSLMAMAAEAVNAEDDSGFVRNDTIGAVYRTGNQFLPRRTLRTNPAQMFQNLVSKYRDVIFANEAAPTFAETAMELQFKEQLARWQSFKNSTNLEIEKPKTDPEARAKQIEDQLRRSYFPGPDSPNRQLAIAAESEGTVIPPALGTVLARLFRAGRSLQGTDHPLVQQMLKDPDLAPFFANDTTGRGPFVAAYRELRGARNLDLLTRSELDNGQRNFTEPGSREDYESRLFLSPLNTPGMQSPGNLQFLAQSAARRNAMEAWMQSRMLLRQQLVQGELPDEVAFGLGSASAAPDARLDPTQTDPRIVMDYVRAINSGELKPSRRASQMDPMAYRSTLDTLERQISEASKELEQGGAFLGPNDEKLARLGRNVGGRQLLLTAAEARMVDSGGAEAAMLAGIMPADVQMTAFSGPNRGLTPAQAATIRRMEAMAVANSALELAPDGSHYINKVTGEKTLRATAYAKGETDIADPRNRKPMEDTSATVVGTGVDEVLRDVVTGKVKKWDEYLLKSTDPRMHGRTTFKDEQAFQAYVSDAGRWKQSLEEQGYALFASQSDLRLTRGAKEGEKYGVTGTADVFAIDPNGRVQVIDAKSSLAGNAWTGNRLGKSLSSWTSQVGVYGELLRGAGFDVAGGSVLPIDVRYGDPARRGNSQTGDPQVTAASLQAMRTLFGAPLGGGGFGGGPGGPANFLASMPSGGGGVVPVQIMNWAEGKAVLGAGATAASAALSSLPIDQRAQVTKANLLADARVRTEAERQDAKTRGEIDRANARYDVRESRDVRAQLQRMARESRSGFPDVGLSTNRDSAFYAENPQELLGDLRKLRNRIRTTTGSASSAMLVAENTADPEERMRQARTFDTSLQNRMIARLQAAQVLAATGDTSAVGMVGLGKQYLTAGRGEAMAEALLRQRSVMQGALTEDEAKYAAAKALQERVKQAQVAATAGPTSFDKAILKENEAFARVQQRQSELERAQLAEAEARSSKEGGTGRLGITARTADAQEKLAEAQKALELASAASQKFRNSGTDVTQEAAKKELEAAQGALANLFNAKTPGQANKAVDALAKSIALLKTDMTTLGKVEKQVLEDMSKHLGVPIKDFKQMEEVIRNVRQAAEAAGKTFDASLDKRVTGSNQRPPGWSGFGEGLARKVMQLSEYTMAGGVVYSFANALRATTRQVVQFDLELRKIQGVLETGSAAQRDQIGRSVTRSALDYGVPLTEALSAARIYAQIGADPSEIETLTRASLAAQQGAGFDASQASEFLIAARTISGGNTQPMDILDRVSRIEARYAVTSQDLAQGIQRAGAVARQFQPESLGGVDAFGTVMGASTQIIESTRVSGNQAATALRFVISRLAQPESANALQDRFGIKLGGADPKQLRPLQDIFSDVANEYNRLRTSGKDQDSVRALELLTTFAGARQAGVIAPLLENFDRVKEISAESSEAFGETQRRTEMALDSVAGRAAQVQTAFFALVRNTLDTSGAIKGVTFGLNQLAKLLSSMAEGAGGSGGAVLTAGLAALVGLGSRNLAGRAAAALVPNAAGALAPGADMLSRFFGAGSRALGLGATGLVGFAALQSMRNAWNVANESEFMGLSSWRTRAQDTSRERDEYTTRISELSSRVGTSPEQLESLSRQALARIRDTFDDKYGKGTYERFLLPSSDPNRYVNTTATDFVNKQVLDVFQDAIPSFENLGTETEQINTAFESLRLVMAGARIETDAYSRSAADAFSKYSTEAFDVGRLTSELTDKGVKRWYDALVPSNELQQRLANRRNKQYSGTLDDLFQVGSANWATSFGRRQVQINGQTTTLQQLVEERGQNRTVGFGTAVASALASAYGASQRDVERFESLRLRMAEERLGALPVGAGMYDRLGAFTQLRTEDILARDPSLRGAAEQLGNRDALVRDMARIALETAGITLPGQNGNAELADSGKAAATELNGIGKEAQALAQAMAKAAKGADLTAEELGRVTRSLLDQRNRESSRADLAELGSGSFRMRSQFLQPYLRYIERQSEISSSQMLMGYGLQYDPLTARAAATQNLVTDLSRLETQVRGPLLNDLLRVAVAERFASPKEIRAQFEGIAIGASLDETLTRAERSGVGRDGELAPDSENLGRMRAALVANQYQFTQFFGDVQKALEVSPALEKEFGGIIPGLRDLMEKALSGKGSTAEQVAAINKFWTELLTTGKTIPQQIAMAAARFGEEAADVFKRDMDITDIQRRTQLATIRASGDIGLRTQQIEIAQQIYDARRRPDESAAARLSAVALRAQDIRQTADIALEGLQERLARQGLTGDSLRFAVGREGAGIITQRDSQLASLSFEERRIVAAENGRRATERNRQAQGLTDALGGNLKAVLADYRTLTAQPGKQLVEGVAATFQNVAVERFVDSLVGPASVFGDRMRTEFMNGAYLTQEAIITGFMQGTETLRYSFEQNEAARMNRTPLMIPGMGNTGLTIGDVGGGVAWQSLLMSNDPTSPFHINNVANASFTGTTGFNPLGFGTSSQKWAGVKQQLLGSAMQMAGSYGGAWLGGQIQGRGKESYASEGASIGMGIGSSWGPVGGMVGGLLGGLVGGLFGKSTPKQDPAMAALEKIERNTATQLEVMEVQTQLLRLDSRLLNVPANFSVPTYRPGGVAAGGGITINVYGTARQSPDALADAVAKSLRKELGMRGGSFDVREM
jgi:hypothetical protein